MWKVPWVSSLVRSAGFSESRISNYHAYRQAFHADLPRVATEPPRHLNNRTRSGRNKNIKTAVIVSPWLFFNKPTARANKLSAELLRYQVNRHEEHQTYKIYEWYACVGAID